MEELIAQAVQVVERILSHPGFLSISWVVLGGVALIWGAMSWILAYHWKSYSFDQSKIRGARKLYFIGSLVLLGAMAGSLFLLSA